ncbi:U32 family peptidase [Nanoarchaeota archaeon]
MIELLAPAGSYECLMSAIKAGADSVYFGIDDLHMRSLSAKKFSIKDIKKIASVCHKNKVKCYLTLNAIMYDNDLSKMKKICDKAKKEGVDAIIAHDVSVLEYAKSIKLPVHISAQANVSNVESVKFYSKFADIVVLARELKLEQIKKIADEIKKKKIVGPSKKLMQVELFGHGALCVSVSGKCYMSLGLYNQSANRGRCLQACRRAYRVIDDETGDELVIDNKFVMSPKDLCTVGFLDQLSDTGVGILKMEGRARSPDYVYAVTKVYREAIDGISTGTYTEEKVKIWIRDLEKVFNRGFWHGGYYLGKKLGEWAGVYGSKSKQQKIKIGKVVNYYSKPKAGHFMIETGKIKVGDQIMITGPTTGIVKTKIKKIVIDDKSVKSAKKGDDVTIAVSEKIRKNDTLFLIK